MKLKQTTFILLLSVGSLSVNAQTVEKYVIGSVGLENSTISATAGEVAITDMNNNVYQGYHHINVTPVSVNNLFIPEHALEVYPNPAHSTLNVQSTFEIKQLEILNITGKVILNQTANFNQIDISNLSPGTYVLKLITTEGIGIRKFIKQ